ncbi:RNA recognition motif domain-containing protein [Paraglaciecola polaris]|uniref:RNA-binding protein n=1 Tax=Paraglaciecola polaris LMG 21857 TaxID=1129793 RepID=K6ZYT9_9ALTE|nr:RNA-binding protein [Paraglaciecola polaris]GAC35352.1 RNA-binding protein [Paraglaciecola polaris LMG 21857]|tara:strand:- start:42 stop:497 length:456 start_codon:yes stop_codon:yes gene_type:complete
MNSPTIINIIIAVALAVAGYFLLPVVAANLDPSLALALGLLLGGILVPVISSQFSGATAVEEQSDDENSKTLYVGNLPYRANEQAVQQHFELQGQVHSVRLMKDRRTGKRKGYGFVEMTNAGAEKAIQNLNDSEFQERTLKVRMAKDKVEE